MLSYLSVALDSNKTVSPSPCDTCFEAKQTREVFYEILNKINNVLNLFIATFGGPYRTRTSSRTVYFLTVVDDFSRAV